MSQLVIGVTGGIASGKTTIANIFASYNIDIIDADIIARDIVAQGSPALKQIKQHFGTDIILECGALNRAKLRHIIFSVQQEKDWLNALLHPLIRQQITRAISLASSPYCLLVAPLLLENKMQNMVNHILVIDAEPQTQIQRTMARDNNSHQQAQAIVNAQINRQQRLEFADDIIKNNDSLNDLTNDVKSLHYKYLSLVQLKNQQLS